MNLLRNYPKVKRLEGIETWDTGKVTRMDYLFYDMHSLWIETLDLTGWDTSNVNNMSYMCYNTGKVVGNPPACLLSC